jgi:hypothetical protein
VLSSTFALVPVLKKMAFFEDALWDLLQEPRFPAPAPWFPPIAVAKEGFRGGAATSEEDLQTVLHMMEQLRTVEAKIATRPGTITDNQGFVLGKRDNVKSMHTIFSSEHLQNQEAEVRQPAEGRVTIGAHGLASRRDARERAERSCCIRRACELSERHCKTARMLWLSFVLCGYLSRMLVCVESMLTGSGAVQVRFEERDSFDEPSYYAEIKELLGKDRVELPQVRTRPLCSSVRLSALVT